MNKHIQFSLCLIVATGFGAGCKGLGQGGSSGGAELKTEDDKTLYTLGLMMGRNAKNFDLTPGELDIVKRGLTDFVTGKKPDVEIDQYGPKIGQLSRTRMTKKAEGEKEKSKGFLEAAAKEEGAEKTASGLVFKSLKAGSGDSPKASDRVKVHYTGKLIDGTVFDSSVERGQPAEFSLSGVVRCWTEGLQKMKLGEKAKLTCPSAIAYGDFGHPPKIPGGAALQFEVELLEIKKEEPPAMGAMSGPPGMMPPGMHPGGPPGAHPMPPGALQINPHAMAARPGAPTPPPPPPKPAK